MFQELPSIHFISLRDDYSWHSFRNSWFRGNNVNIETQSAKEAGLKYVSDRSPGISRKKNRKSFSYFHSDGSLIKDEKTLARIRKLAIPPAYNKVWICPNESGHLQATGRDARDRKQYRYHEKWRTVRDSHKYDRMLKFGKALPKIRKSVETDLQLSGLPRKKVIAAVVCLLEKTLIRVGNEEYAKENSSYGLTTLHNQHAVVEGSQIHFEFRGKSKIHHSVDLNDRRLAKIIAGCQDLPGHELFQYLDENGGRHSVSSEDVNHYLREITQEEFTAKDFRTWAGTALAVFALKELAGFDSEMAAKKRVNLAIEAVSKKLRNTKAICRKCYVHPAVIEAFMENRLGKESSIDSPEQLEEILDERFSHIQDEERKVFRLVESWSNRAA
jgi:DNA topoisomerase-1